MKALTKNSLGCPLMNSDTPQNSSKTFTPHIPTNLVLRLLRCFRSPLPSPHFLFLPHLRQSFPTLVPSFPRLVTPLHPFLRPPFPPLSSVSLVFSFLHPPTSFSFHNSDTHFRPSFPPSSVTLCLTSHVLLPLLFFSLSFSITPPFSPSSFHFLNSSIKSKQIYKK